MNCWRLELRGPWTIGVVALGIGLLSVAGGTRGLAARDADSAAEKEAAKIFEKTILPTLKEHCFECHSASATELKGNLKLDSREGLRRGGANGTGIVPGEPDRSFVLKAISYREDDYKMPPRGKLDEEILKAFTKWVEAGAPDSRAQ